MYINQKELEELGNIIMGSDDPHSEPFKQFLRDLTRINEAVKRLQYFSDSQKKEIGYNASWGLSTVNTALRQHEPKVKDKKIKGSVKRLVEMAYALLIETDLRAYPESSYKEEPWALHWSFIRDKTIADAMITNQPQLIWYEQAGSRASCIPIKDMKEFTVVPYKLPVVVGVVKEDVDEKLKEWFKEQDRVDCEEFLYGSEEFAKKWAESNHITGENEFTRVVSKIISRLYNEKKVPRIVALGIGDATEVKRVFNTLQKRVNKEKYEIVVNSTEIIGVDKFSTNGKYSFQTMNELGIKNYKLVKCDMVDFIPDERDVTTLYLLSSNTRNNLDEDKRRLLDKNVVRNLKKGDLYIRDEYYPIIGKELETALEYANYPPAHACLNRALNNGAVALVVQYNPNHSEGGNVEFFSVYKDKPVYRIHFRSLRRNIDTIKKDGPLLGCNIEIHVDSEEHMVTSVFSK